MQQDLGNKSPAGPHRVSIIVPFYGRDSTALFRCLEAISNQDYPTDSMQVVVVDNNPLPLIEALPALSIKCSLLLHQSKPGSYAARNTGLVAADGSIVAFTDADCVPDPAWIREGVRILLETENCGIVAGAILPRFLKEAHPNNCELYDFCVHLRQKDYAEEQHFGATANVFTYATTFEKVGLFDENFFSGGDRDWGIRVWKQGLAIVYASDSIVRHEARNNLPELFNKARRLVGQGYVIARKKRLAFLRLCRGEFRLSFVWLRLINRNREMLGRRRAGVLGVYLCVQLVRFGEVFRLTFSGKQVR